MDLIKLTLNNFRNFDTTEVELPPGGLLIAAAPNATGKTNFLESIVMLLRGKSFRARPEECVRWGADTLLLQGTVRRQQGESHIALRYHKPSRLLRLEEDGVPASPVTFYGDYPLVVFLPEDTYLFTRGPAGRRNFLNRVLVTNSGYVSALVQYQRVLRQRNARLKQAASFGDIAAWTDLLLEHGTALWQQRSTLVRFLQTHIAEMYERVSGETREFTLDLGSPYEDTAAFRAALEQNFSDEQRYGYTLIGPHRDDIEATTGSDRRPVAATLSQGQMRSLILALKLATHRFVVSTTKEEPILLFDEVLSELDDERQAAFLASLPSAQIVLTSTTVPDVLRQRPNAHLLDLRSLAGRETSSPAEPAAQRERAAV